MMIAGKLHNYRNIRHSKYYHMSITYHNITSHPLPTSPRGDKYFPLQMRFKCKGKINTVRDYI